MRSREVAQPRDPRLTDLLPPSPIPRAVTSDCDADSDVFFRHNYTRTPEETVQAILRAGADVDCGKFMKTYAPTALAGGQITQTDIDTVLTRLFRVRIRLAQFDPPGVLATIGVDQICSDYARELARDGVRQSAVLLKNDRATLPLDAKSVKSVVVIGPALNITDTVLYYGGLPCDNATHSVMDAITQHGVATTFLPGVPDVGSNDTSGVAAAAAAAAAADVVVLAVGSDLLLEREAHDRTVTNFSDGQLALIAAVAAAAKGPVVALLFGGGATDVTPLMIPTIEAVLWLGQPSVQVVGAGDVLFGKTLDGRPVAPAGRMTQMIYPASYVDAVSMFDFGMRPGPSAWPPGTNPGRTYRFYTGAPVVPFGFGLSYTTWSYAPFNPPGAVSLAAVRAAAGAHAATGVIGHIPAGLKANAVDFFVNVTNTGAVDSDDVVLGFLVPPGAGVDGTPLQELFGFERVFVPAGQTVTVYLGAQGVRFTQAGKDGVRRALAGEYKVRFGVRETAAGGGGFAETKLVVSV